MREKSKLESHSHINDTMRMKKSMEKYRIIFHSFIMVINTAKLEFESFRKCDCDSVDFPSAINNDVWIAATFLHTIPTHGHM